MINDKKRIFALHILYFTIICAYILILTIFKIGCPSQFLFKIPCAGCGGTRAIISLLHFDIVSYIYYQPFAVPMCISIWLVLHIRIFRGKGKRIAAYSIAFSILALNEIFFIWRWINGLIP